MERVGIQPSRQPASSSRQSERPGLFQVGQIGAAASSASGCGGCQRQSHREAIQQLVRADLRAEVRGPAREAIRSAARAGRGSRFSAQWEARARTGAPRAGFVLGASRRRLRNQTPLHRVAGLGEAQLALDPADFLFEPNGFILCRARQAAGEDPGDFGAGVNPARPRRRRVLWRTGRHRRPAAFGFDRCADRRGRSEDAAAGVLGCRASPCLRSAALHRLLAWQIRILANRVDEYSTLDVRARVHAEFLRLARPDLGEPPNSVISPPPTHAELAARVSCRREAVTRELNALAHAGVIVRRRGAIVLTDPAALARSVEKART